ncbi:MAG TPA: glycosyltransferase family A protein [Gammaproteobacteria bacterium]
MATGLDILIPTIDRRESLIYTLAGVALQDDLARRRIVVADQSDPPVEQSPVVRTLRRIIEARGGEVEWHQRGPSNGIAEQRDFLLGRARAPAVLFLDDDVIMEPWVGRRLLDVLEAERCGFVGAFPAGLSFRDDVRPAQQVVDYWDGPVEPEQIGPATPEWRRAHLHRAANAWHASLALPPGVHRLYKVAWVASCVIYDREKLLDVGGFGFWRKLPRYHSGEDVLVQNLLMRRWGGCAILPSGTYHAEVPSTVLNAAGTVDGHALALLDDAARAAESGARRSTRRRASARS